MRVDCEACSSNSNDHSWGSEFECRYTGKFREDYLQWLYSELGSARGMVEELQICEGDDCDDVSLAWDCGVQVSCVDVVQEGDASCVDGKHDYWKVSDFRGYRAFVNCLFVIVFIVVIEVIG